MTARRVVQIFGGWPARHLCRDELSPSKGCACSRRRLSIAAPAGMIGASAERAFSMKFGIFYELQLPRPWTEDGELTLYQNALDQVELADKLGYDTAWEVEHHFLEEYSHS